LDVHKDTVVACARTVAEGSVRYEVKTFGTTTKALMALADWLNERGCTHAAMEATGVYWKPVWHMLEESLELVLANAQHIKNVPGRKTDVNDATWIADLLAHGLIRASFVPPSSIQELRTLTRTRKQMVRERAQHIQRLQKVLEDANLKLSSVVTDVVGKSGRAILDALVDGITDPKLLAGRASERIKASRETLQEALRGRVTKNHRFLLKLHLKQIDQLERAIADIEAEAGTVLAPFRDGARRLVTMPGISETMAQTIVSEIGVDMSRFPTAGHLVSWAGLCPRNDESAGKRRSTRLRKGAPWLKTALVQAAWAASRAKNTYLRAQYYRLKSRRGPKKAVVAVAASMLKAIYFMLRDGAEYRELGPAHFDSIDRAKSKNRLVRRLQDLGYAVDIRDAA
jgi:transposase